MRDMIGYYPSYFFVACWGVFTPLICGGVFIFKVVINIRRILTYTSTVCRKVKDITDLAGQADFCKYSLSVQQNLQTLTEFFYLKSRLRMYFLPDIDGLFFKVGQKNFHLTFVCQKSPLMFVRVRAVMTDSSDKKFAIIHQFRTIRPKFYWRHY